MPETMRQAVIVAPDRFEVRSAPRPALEDPGDVLVRTALSGICSGDLMPWYLAKKVGTVLGHEVVGWAVEVGPAVTNIQAGDLVFLHHHAPCLHCPECARGAYVHCSTWKRSHIDPGGMAEWIRVPAVNVRGDTLVVNDLHPDQTVFIEPLACSVKAFSRLTRAAQPHTLAHEGGPACSRRSEERASREQAGLLPLQGTRGVVVGCGIMGLLNIAAARALGAGEVLAVEPDADRRQAALRAGAARALTPDQTQAELRQQADFVIIGPGQPEVIRQALALVRPAGVAVLFTPTATGTVTPLDLGDLYFREISLVPSYSCGPSDTRLACDLLRRGLVRPEPFITHRFRLDDIQAAYDTARKGGSALKVVVTMPEDQP